MNPYIDVVIQNNSELNRQYLLDLKQDAKIGIDTHVVYVYFLKEEFLNYPNKPGNIIYIGEAGRPSEKTAKRFSQHISTEVDKGGDSGTIYSLSRYYWLGKKIRLKIFLLPSKTERKTLERNLLNAHVKEYGSLPICQGTTGDNYKTSDITALNIPNTIISMLT